MVAKKKTGNKSLFRMEDQGAAADGKGKIYRGYVGGHCVGACQAPTKTAAKAKLLRAARKLLK